MKTFLAAILTLLAFAADAAEQHDSTPPDDFDSPMDSTILSPSDFAYGVSFATGPRFTAGRMAEFFSWAWDFTFSAKAGWRDAWLMGSISFASPSIKKNNLITGSLNPDDNFRATVKSANYTAFGLNLGYTVYKSYNLSVTPFAGGIWTRYHWTARPLLSDPITGEQTMGDTQSKMSCSDFNIDFGVDFEWHFNTGIFSASSGAQQLVSSLIVTPYAVHGTYSSANYGSLGGWQLGIRIGYSATAKKLKPLRLF